MIRKERKREMIGQLPEMKFTFTKDAQTGEVTTSPLIQPEELVRWLREHEQKMCIARGSCAECIYTPDRPVSSAHIQQMQEEFLSLHCFPECTCGGVAAHMRRREYPAAPCGLVCYAFYYQFWQQNMYQRAVTEAGLVQFYDTSLLPGTRGVLCTGYELLDGIWRDTRKDGKEKI